MKAKLKRILPICLVVIFFIVALVAEHLPVSNAEELLKPNVTFKNNGNGTFTLEDITSDMLYNTESADYEGDWSEVLENQIINLEGEMDLFIKYKDGESEVQILPVRNNYAITFSWNVESSNSIKLSTVGGTYIDWGDGEVEYINSSSVKEYSHTYEASGKYTVKVVDNVVTYFDCDNRGVESLDVSYNTRLIELHCSDNAIASLNLKKNTLLEELYCNNNNFSELNLANSTSLKKISCVQNTTLKVSALSYFDNTDLVHYVKEGLNEISENKGIYIHDEKAELTISPMIISDIPDVKYALNDDGSTYRLYYEIEDPDNEIVLEYNTEGPEAVEWITWTGDMLNQIKFNSTYYIRVKAVENKRTASLAKEVYVKVVDIQTTTHEDDSETATITGMTTEMEYNYISANLEDDWTGWQEGALKDIAENKTVFVRMKGTKSPVLEFEISLIERPDAPSVTCGYDETDGSAYLIDMKPGMEYNTTDPDDEEGWILYDAKVDDLQNITETTTFYIRVAESGNIPSGKILQLEVVVNKKANVSIEQNDDGSYRIDGMKLDMEYTSDLNDDDSWSDWAGTELQKITESESYFVRVKGSNSVTVLNVFVIKLQENADRSYNIIGVTEKMQYSLNQIDWYDYDAEVFTNVDEDCTFYVRVKENGKIPVGEIYTIPVVIRPDVPDIEYKDHGNGTYSILRVDSRMEYNTTSADLKEGWIQCNEDDFIGLTEITTYYIRIAETASKPAGRVLVIPVSVAPHAPDVEPVQDPVTGVVTIEGMEDGMEYNTEAKDLVGEWTKQKDTPIGEITDTITYYIRYAANGNIPAGAVTTVNIVFNVKVTATAGEHGSISSSGDSMVIGGASKTYTFTPDEGYIVDDVLVNGVSVGARTTYTFTNITENQTIEVIFKEKVNTGVCGDLNGDGLVDAGDAMLILQYIEDTTLAIDLTNADVNEDGNVNIFDAEILFAHSGFITGFETLPYTGKVVLFMESEEDNSPEIQAFVTDETKALATNTFEKTDYIFEGWSDTPNGDVKYEDGADYTATTDMILYAVWEKIMYGDFDGDGYVSAADQVTLSQYVNKVIDTIDTVRADVNVDGEINEFDCYVLSAHSIKKEGFKELPFRGKIVVFKVEGVDYFQAFTAEGNLEGNTITKEGYTFNGWSTEENAEVVYNDAASYPGDANIVLYAVWRENIATTYTVTVTAGEHGTLSLSGEIDVIEGEDLEVAITPDEGYEIDVILVNNVEDVVSENYVLENVTADTTLEVRFKLKTYEITYMLNDTDTFDETQEKIHGEELVLTSNVPEKEGYNFVTWNTEKDGSGTNYAPGATYSENAVLTLYAQWELKKYTVNYDLNYEGAPNDFGTFEKIHGQATYLSETIPERDGYNFLGWATTAGSPVAEYNAGGRFENDGNTVLYAVWIEAVNPIYVITVIAGENGKVEPDGEVILTMGEEKEFIFIPDEGYEVADLKINGVSVGATPNYLINSANGNETIEVSFKLKTYTVTYDLNGGEGVIEPQVKNYGEDLILTDINPLREGYIFLGWARESTASDYEYVAGDTFTLNENATLYAVWKKAYTITLTVGENGTVEPNGEIKVVEGGNKTFTITPNSGYEIADILVNDVSVGADTVLVVENITSDVTVKVTFKEILYATIFSWKSNGNNTKSLVIRANNPTKIDWGDGEVEDITPSDVDKELTHDYAEGEYTVKIKDDVITKLECSSENVLTLDVTRNTALVELDCSNNELGELNLGSNGNLVSLDCSENNLTGLNLDSNEELVDLDCSDNGLTGLSLRKNTRLKKLACSNNELESLDISNNDELTEVACSQESLKDIYLTEIQAKNVVITKHDDTVTFLLAPEITVVDNKDGSYRLEGINTTMEYNTTSANYAGKWTKYVSGKLQKITEKVTYYVRISKTETRPQSLVATVHVSPTTFAITVTSDRNGTISPSGTVLVVKGGNKTFTITPNSGYKIADVFVDGKSVGAVESYTFKNVTKSHKISVEFRKVENVYTGGGSYSGGITLSQGIINSKWKNKFKDVSKGDWYYDVVEFVNERKYFAGITKDSFGPDIPMTREMFMVALYNMEKNPITYGPNNYYDVTPGHWSEAAIVWGSAKGIIAGFPDGSFRPAEPVTREQVATIMKKYAEYKYKYTLNRADLSGFNDSTEIYDWAYDSISWAVAKGIMKGDNHNYILPHKSATRAEVAAMFMNYKKMD